MRVKVFVIGFKGTDKVSVKLNYLRFIAIKNVLSCYTLFKKADLKH